MEYLCHKWHWYGPFVVIRTGSFLNYDLLVHHVCSKSNTTAATSGAGSVRPSGTHEFTLWF
jgi:hypothetical protein